MKKQIILTAAFLLLAGCFTTLLAQSPPPPPPPAAVPIDGGLGLLLAVGAGLGAKKALETRKKSNLAD
ncbi:MAG: PID-CTERM protein-sorting domain-containing protein [Bacteroidia bacterium]